MFVLDKQGVTRSNLNGRSPSRIVSLQHENPNSIAIDLTKERYSDIYD